MMAATAVGLVLGFSPGASGQSCSSTGTSVSQSGTGTLRVQSQTTATAPQGGDCSGRTTNVKNYIVGRDFECSGDESQGYCVAQATGSNAVTTAMDDGCGQWAGNGEHNYVEGGSTTGLSNSSASLNGGSCGDPCNMNQTEQDCTVPCSWESGTCFTPPPSPIIIDTDKSAKYELTSAAQGVIFDIDGDGDVEQISWTPPGSTIAFLAVDRDGDGLITSGKELFGNATWPGARNGFDALAQMSMATNGGIARHSVSSDDPLYASLLLWTDRNHNGISEPAELRPASELISDIGLGYQLRKKVDEFGNAFAFRGWVHIRTKEGRNASKDFADNKGRLRHIWDVYFKRLF